MPTIRTILTSLLLGMLLLPPHWCCAFPAIAPATEAPPTDFAVEAKAPQPAACCALHAPPVAAKTVRSCCVANTSAPTSGLPDRSDISDVRSAPLDTAHCPFCTPKVIASTAKPVAPPLAQACLPAILAPAPQFTLEASATLVQYGESIPISGHTLARLCRWNC